MIEFIGRIDESLRINSAKLDLKDKQIISILAENSRMPFTQMKKSIMLSRDSIDYRVKRLKKKNILLNFFPTINLKKFGFFTFHTFLILEEKNSDRIAEFLLYLKSLPYVKNIIEYSDIWDLEIVSIAKNVWDYDQKFNQITSKFPDLIQEKEKIQVIKGYNSVHLPYQFLKNAKYNSRKDIARNDNKEVDETDIKILQGLCTDARLPYHEISEKVGLTAEAVGYRVNRMVSSNVIRQFTSLINLSSLGYHWFTLMVQTKTFNNELDAKMKRFVLTHPYIIRAVKTLGRWDFMFYVVADNPKQFHITVKEVKREFSDIIKNYDTLLAYKENYFSPLPAYVLEYFSGKETLSEQFYKDIED